MRIGGIVAAAAVVLALPSSSRAQDTIPERASFYLLLRGDTIFEERSARTPTELSGEFVDRLRGARVSYTAALAPNALVTRIDMRTYRTTDDTAGEKASFVIDGDSVVAQIGSAPPALLPSASGALVIINPAAAFLEQMARRARTFRSDSVAMFVFVLGAPQPIAAIVRRIGPDSVRLDYASASIRLAVSPEGRVLGGVVPAQGVTIARGPARPSLRAARTDYTAPRDAPYTAEDVVVTTPAGLRLTGTLTVPRGRPSGRAPAVVTITGSGPEDRDEQSGVIPGYRPFRELADTLGRRGIAVLRLDDRGVNRSDAGPPSATSADFADDIRAAVAYLRARPEIDAARIALVGHSEGGIIAPMVAVGDSAIRGIVLMAGTASTGREIVAEQNRYVIDSVRRIAGAQRDSAIARSRRGADSLAAKSPWLRYFFDYDPTEIARRVRTPVLILHGETDRQVSPTEAQKLAGAFRAGGNRDVTVRLFPATDHLFVEDASGAFMDGEGRLRYTSLPSLHVRREVLGAIADWLASHFR
ncbi:MAG TPA: alpha/beta fold hydrolase [Gemmatimonadaceae bacterium]|nr:alpha/beta fold hydrolase [Gemmatimonadaceae bacterium]